MHDDGTALSVIPCSILSIKYSELSETEVRSSWRCVYDHAAQLARRQAKASMLELEKVLQSESAMLTAWSPRIHSVWKLAGVRPVVL